MSNQDFVSSPDPALALVNPIEPPNGVVGPSQICQSTMRAPPIDAVYLWVDGSEPEFSQHLQTCLTQETPHPSAIAPQRFRDNQELRYSLRSLYRFAPWIRKIFIVTNGQVPDWLNLEHPKIKVIIHSEIFSCPQGLPTFNSLAIEWQLHRIPGLSEFFLQLNDDFFIGRPVSPQDFLTPLHGVKIFLEKKLISPNPSANVFYASASETLRTLRSLFGSSLELGFPAHMPRLFLRSVLEELEKTMAAEVRRTSRSRFRAKDDLLLPAAHAGWLKATRRPIDQEVILSEPSEAYRFLRLDGAWWWWSRSLVHMALHPPLFYCINDDLQPGALSWIARKVLRLFFCSVLGRRSPYEKP